MLFKKSKGPIITLGLGPPPAAERAPEKAAPPAAPPEPATVPPGPEPAAAAPAPAAESGPAPEPPAAPATTVPMKTAGPATPPPQQSVSPVEEELPPSALLYPHTPPLPHKPPVTPPAGPREIPKPPAVATGPASAPAAGDGGFLAPEAPMEHTQCPYCLELTPAGKDRCDHCGNRLGETGALGPIPASAPSEAPAAEPTAAAGAPAVEEDARPASLEPETRKLTTKPTPTVLKETTIFTPAQLTLLDDPRKDTGQVFALKIGETRIGRGQDNDLPFPDEEFISRHHCEIGYHKYQYVLKDLQSANGSYVNDVRVKETILRDGDTIQIGSLRFLFEDPVEKMKKKKAEAGADRE